MDNSSSTMSSNKTIDIDKLNHERVMDQLFILIFYIIILVIGIIGNILVLFVYKHKLKRSSARVYIISLALTDLCVCIVGIPYITLDQIWIMTYTKAGVCKAMSFLMSAGSLSSVFVLLVVGLDRYLKVCRPLKRQIRDFGNRKACIIAVVAGIVVGLPMLELYGEATYDVLPGITESNCYVDDEYTGSMLATIYLSLYILIFIASVIYLSIVYGFICKKIYEHDKMEGAIVLKKKRGLCGCVQEDDDDDNDEGELNEDQCLDSPNGTELQSLRKDECGENDDTNTQSAGTNKVPPPTKSERKKVGARSSTGMQRHTAGKKQENATRKITLMMFTITVVFIIAYLPFLIISILSETIEDYWESMGKFEELIHNFLMRLYVVNNVANPIIYCFWDKRLRKECVHLVKKYLCCSDDSDYSPKNSSSLSSGTRVTVMPNTR